jgi:hypothetical protein
MQLTTSALLGIGCFLCVQGLGAGEARAAGKAKVEGFELLGGVGYGLALEEPDRKYGQPPNRNPYGVLLGIDGGYSWRSGLRLGFVAQCGSGEYACSNLLGGASVGYDILFSSFRFRSSLEGGFWYAYAPWLYIAPAIALIWQHGSFELGLGSKYLVAPINGVQLMLMSGTRF